MTTRRKRGVARVSIAVLALGLVVLASGGPVRADESRRRQLRDEIERLLSDMASELREVPGDSSTSDLDRTIDYAGRVSEKARDLKNEADDDSDARRMGESYPDIASRYKDAAGYLRELKNGHRKIDEWPRKCEDATRDLVSRMRAYTDSPDPRGVDEVPRLARELMHELLTELGVAHAILGIWPSFTWARCDTWLTNMILDTPRGDIDLGLPAEFQQQTSLAARWYKFIGRTYARHPRWGTYLHDAHLAAIGGLDRIRAEVDPARIDRVGELTYIQLTGSIDTALTPAAGDKRRRLAQLMAPILVGAPRAAAG